LVLNERILQPPVFLGKGGKVTVWVLGDHADWPFAWAISAAGGAGAVA
jgi:hypothetical protein